MSKKDNSRRTFITKSLLAGTGISLLGSNLSCGSSSKNEIIETNSSKKLNILILGGTSFLGPHQIAYAIDRGHSISIFTRGKSKPTIHKDYFNKVEHLVGDRENDLAALKNRKWDAVIDNSGRNVKWTKDTTELLKDNVEIYVYTSSVSVYYPYLDENITEDKELVLETPINAEKDEKYIYDYGVMKANSEIEVVKNFGKNRSILVRPTYMMGPGDNTDRFTHWPVRLNEGGEILIPGKPDDPVQYIDVRDVAEWMIRLIENKTFGKFNALGPISKTGMHQFVYGAHSAFNSKATFVYIPDYDFLAENNVLFAVPWIPPIGKHKTSALVSGEKAIANGLTFTPLAKSCKDIVEWWKTDAVSEKHRDNLRNGKYSLMKVEKEVIAKWKSKS